MKPNIKEAKAYVDAYDQARIRERRLLLIRMHTAGVPLDKIKQVFQCDQKYIQMVLTASETNPDLTDDINDIDRIKEKLEKEAEMKPGPLQQSARDFIKGCDYILRNGQHKLILEMYQRGFPIDWITSATKESQKYVRMLLIANGVKLQK
jgi:DNA-binding transcriptional MerR regulator